LFARSGDKAILVDKILAAQRDRAMRGRGGGARGAWRGRGGGRGSQAGGRKRSRACDGGDSDDDSGGSAGGGGDSEDDSDPPTDASRLADGSLSVAAKEMRVVGVMLSDTHYESLTGNNGVEQRPDREHLDSGAMRKNHPLWKAIAKSSRSTVRYRALVSSFSAHLSNPGGMELQVKKEQFVR
jgi:hypothetical protein